MVAGDAQLYEESISITTIQSFLGNLVEIVCEHYPELNHRFLSESSGTYHWLGLELKSPRIHFDPDLGPNDVVRMVICDRIWENPAYGINAQFAQCAFLVPLVKNYESPDFAISMSES